MFIRPSPPYYCCCNNYIFFDIVVVVVVVYSWCCSPVLSFKADITSKGRLPRLQSHDVRVQVLEQVCGSPARGPHKVREIF